MLSRVRGGTRHTISNCVVFGYLQATFGYPGVESVPSTQGAADKKSKLGLPSVNTDRVKVTAIQAIKNFSNGGHGVIARVWRFGSCDNVPLSCDATDGFSSWFNFFGGTGKVL